jgi:crotonobetainyl-CoA:carnitine CoA-transferase CaiB-like acyl-CoA transferase
MGLLGYLAEIYLVTGESPGRMGNSHHNIVPYGLMPVKNGHIVLALHVGGFWRNFCRAIEREDLISDPRFLTVKDRHANRVELERQIGEIMMTRTAAEWQTILDAADVPHGPVNSIGEALNQPVVQASGLIRETHHPTAGKVKMVGSPLRFPGRYAECPLDPPPLLGEHTREVLRSLAGMEDSTIDKLISAGIIATPDDKDSPKGKRISDEK